MRPRCLQPTAQQLSPAETHQRRTHRGEKIGPDRGQRGRKLLGDFCSEHPSQKHFSHALIFLQSGYWASALDARLARGVSTPQATGPEEQGGGLFRSARLRHSVR